MRLRALVVLPVVVILAIMAWVPTAHARPITPPNGYRCGLGGIPVVGKGCLCPKDKIESRDSDDNAICVVRARRSSPAAAPPPRRAHTSHRAWQDYYEQRQRVCYQVRTPPAAPRPAR